MELNRAALREEITHRFKTTPNYVHGVGYGLKYVNNERTDTPAIVFSVDKKKPLQDIPPDERIPPYIVIDGVQVPTDVKETPRAAPLGSCYNSFDTVQPAHEITRLRGVPEALLPMRGGQEIIMFPDGWRTDGNISVGTLGFFAIDRTDGRIVGVTNTHVAVPNLYYAGDPLRHTPDDSGPLSAVYPEVYSPMNTIEPRFWLLDGNRYPAGCLIPDGAAGYKVHHAGLHIKRYVPYSSTEGNFVDAALLIMNNERHMPTGKYYVDENSYRIWLPTDVEAGITAALAADPTIVPPGYDFATTDELDSLALKTRLYSTGRTTGPKGYCEEYAESQLILASVNQTVVFGRGVNFFNTLSYTVNRVGGSNAFAAVLGGDSGSALLADFTVGGVTTRKIVGLVFAGSAPDGIPDGETGYACRIDLVQEMLKIDPWLPGEYTFDRATSLSIPRPVLVTRDTADHGLDLTIENDEYWHAGLTTRRDIPQFPPTDITTTPANLALAENTVGGTLVCLFSATDADAIDTFTYTLVDGVGDDDNALFYIVGAQLRVNLLAGQSFSAPDTLSIRVRVTDNGGAYYEKIFAIAITQAPTQTPTDITLTLANATLQEFNIGDYPAGYVVIGTLTTTDPDTEAGINDEFSYSLVNNDIYPNNDNFEIFGDQLRANKSLEEYLSPYTIKIRSTDLAGLYVEKVFNIVVVPQPTAPTNLTFASTDESVPTNLLLVAAGELAGTFSATPGDGSSGNLVYSLVAGDGDDHNALFTIPAGTNELRAINKLTYADFDATLQSGSTTVLVRFRCTDVDTELYAEQTTSNIGVSVIPPAPPQNLALTQNNVTDFMYVDPSAGNAVVGELSALTSAGVPGDATDFTYALVDDLNNPYNSRDNNLFEIFEDGTAVKLRVKTTGATLTYADAESGGFYFTVQVTEGATGKSTTANFTVVPDQPINYYYVAFSDGNTSLTLSGTQASRSFSDTLTNISDPGTVYGQETYTLVSDDTGNNYDLNNNLFEIVNGQLQNTGVLEVGTTYSVYIQISSTGAAPVATQLQINVQAYVTYSSVAFSDGNSYLYLYGEKAVGAFSDTLMNYVSSGSAFGAETYTLVSDDTGNNYDLNNNLFEIVNGQLQNTGVLEVGTTYSVYIQISSTDSIPASTLLQIIVQPAF